MNTPIAYPETPHTPEPWRMDWHFIVAPDPNGIYPDIYIGEIAEADSSEPPRIASPDARIANGHRIVAAVNACRGIPLDALEQDSVHRLIAMLEEATEELAAWRIGAPQDRDDPPPEAVRQCRALLAAVKGETPAEETPLSSPPRFQSYEIAPVRHDGPDGGLEVCAPSQADFWTLYGYIENEGVEAIADRDTQADCEDLLYRITGHRHYYFNRLEEEGEART